MSNSIEAYFNSDTILILGPKVFISRASVDFLIDLGFRDRISQIFIAPEIDQSIQHLFKNLLEDIVFPLTRELSIDVRKPSIWAGITPMDNRFSWVKKQKNKVYLFHEDLGPFGNQFEKKFHYVELLDKDLNKFLTPYLQSKITPQNSIDLSKDHFFVNRVESIKAFKNAYQEEQYRVLKIIGMPGIGKRSFLNELKREKVFGESCFEFHFQDKDDSLSDIILTISAKFGMNLTEQEVYGIEIRNQRIGPIILSLFRKIDLVEGAKLIFYNLELVFDYDRRQFYDFQISLFFKHLIQRKGYSGNKIILVCNSDVQFPIEYGIDSRMWTKKLNPFSSDHLIEIIINDLQPFDKPKLSKAVRGVDRDELTTILGGHPQLAKIFGEAIRAIGINSILEDPDFKKEFEQDHKIKYLISKIDISNRESQLLKTLSLLKTHFTPDLVKNIARNPIKDIRILISKFLVEVIHTVGGIEYYLTDLIRGYGISLSSDEELEQNHIVLAKYFGNQAEGIDLAPDQSLEAFRLAFYHYKMAKSLGELEYLSIRFQTKMLQIAHNSYRDRLFPRSWFYFNELYDKNLLTNPDDLAKYLESEAIYKKTASTEEKILDSLKQFPENEPIRATWVRFLHFDKRYEEARSEAELFYGKAFPFKSDRINNIYPNTLFGLGLIEEAIQCSSKWFSKIEDRIAQLSTHNKASSHRERQFFNCGITLCKFYLKKVDQHHINLLKTTFQWIKRKNPDYIKLAELFSRDSIHSHEIISTYTGYLAATQDQKEYDRIISSAFHYCETKHIDPEQIQKSLEKGKKRVNPIRKDLKTERAIDSSYQYLINKMSSINNESNNYEDLHGLQNLLKSNEDIYNECLNVLRRINSLVSTVDPYFQSYFSIKLAVLKGKELTRTTQKALAISNDPERAEIFLRSIERRIVFLEGISDKEYFDAATNLYELSHLNIDFHCIGSDDNKGGAKNSGHTAMTAAKNYHISNPDTIPDNYKYIFLYDSDVKKIQNEEIGPNLYQMKMPLNDNNTLYKIGVENLLSLDNSFPKEDFYTSKVLPPKPDEYGGYKEIKDVSLHKTKLCNWICTESPFGKRKQYLEEFRNLILTLNKAFNGEEIPLW